MRKDNWIPYPYKVILKRLEEYSSLTAGLEVSKARRILSNICRIPKNIVTPTLNELRDLGWIEFLNCKYMRVIKKVDCELLPRHPSQVARRRGIIF